MDGPYMENDFNEILKIGHVAGNDVIIRPGNCNDVEEPSPDDQQTIKEKLPPKIPFGSNYTEEEFSREFLEDESDVDKLYENDVRKIPNYDILEGEVKSVEDVAQTISSLEIFNSGGKNYYCCKVHIPGEDPRTIDLDVQDNSFYLYTHQYKLRAYFGKPVQPKSTKATFIHEKSVLEIRVAQLK